MVNKCAVANCKTGYETGPRKSVFLFPEKEDLREKWIYFINRKDWTPSKYSVICIDHFIHKFIKFGKRCKLNWELSPVPTLHTDNTSPLSTLRTPVITQSKATAADNSLYAGYSQNASGDMIHCDDVSVDLSPDQILGDDGDLSRTSVSPPASRPESFKLSHNNHLSIVLDSLASDESFMDVTLTAQGKSIKAHKSVLSAVSPYFKGVLKANPCQHPIIIMPRDITFEQLKNIIAYVYKGEMTVAASELSNLLKTAELLQVSGLSPSETGGNSFTDETSSPQQPASFKWMDYASPSQRTVKTPVKTAKPVSKKRHRSHSGEENSPLPSPKRTAEFQDNSSEMTCVKEEQQSGNEFEEMEYPAAASGIDDPGENSASLSVASESSIKSDERNDPLDPLDPLLLPKTESTHETVFECAFCNKSFVAKLDQDAHIKASHPSKQICVCSCGKSFPNPVDLEDHKQSCLMI